MKIDETISGKDSMSRAEAIEYGLPIKDDMNSYTLTSDEYLLLVSTIKKKVIDELETLMKSAWPLIVIGRQRSKPVVARRWVW